MTRMARMARTVARMAHWLADLADSYWNRDKLWPDELLGSYADLPVTIRHEARPLNIESSSPTI